MPLRSRNMLDICENRLDAELINSICSENQLSFLYDLINLSLQLQIKSLLYLGCSKVASLIKGQPLDQIRQILDPRRTLPKEHSKEEYNAQSQAPMQNINPAQAQAHQAAQAQQNTRDSRMNPGFQSGAAQAQAAEQSRPTDGRN